jgi:hypothetical protein
MTMMEATLTVDELERMFQLSPEPTAEADLAWQDQLLAEPAKLLGQAHLHMLMTEMDLLGFLVILPADLSQEKPWAQIGGDHRAGFTVEIAHAGRMFPSTLGRTGRLGRTVELPCAGRKTVTVRSAQVLTADEAVQLTFSWMSTGIVPDGYDAHPMISATPKG